MALESTTDESNKIGAEDNGALQETSGPTPLRSYSSGFGKTAKLTKPAPQPKRHGKMPVTARPLPLPGRDFADVVPSTSSSAYAKQSCCLEKLPTVCCETILALQTAILTAIEGTHICDREQQRHGSVAREDRAGRVVHGGVGRRQRQEAGPKRKSGQQAERRSDEIIK